MTQRIVHGLEPIEVTEQQPNWLRVAGVRQHMVQQLQSAASVVETSQRIMGCLMSQTLVGRGELIVDARELAAFVGQISQQSFAAPLQTDRFQRVATDDVLQHDQRQPQEHGDHAQASQTRVVGADQRPRRQADERHEEGQV